MINLYNYQKMLTEITKDMEDGFVLVESQVLILREKNEIDNKYKPILLYNYSENLIEETEESYIEKLRLDCLMIELKSKLLQYSSLNM